MEQKKLKEKSFGCKNQLLINKMIMKNYRSKEKIIIMAWIDYKYFW